MFKHSLSPFLVAALVSCLTAACGGTQSTDRSPSSWSYAHEAIPEAAAWAVWVDLDATDDDLQGLLQHGVGGPQGVLLNAIMDRLGLDPTDPDSVGRTGVDLGGDLAAFSTRLQPVVVVRLSDPSAFRSRLDEVVERNPDFVRTDVRHGGLTFANFEDTTTQFSFDVAVDGNWAIARLTPTETVAGVDDATLADLVRGRTGPAFLDGVVGAELLSRIPPGANLRSFVHMPTTAFADGLQAILHNGDTLAALASQAGIRLLAPTYPSPEVQQQCLDAQERIVTTLPGLASLAWADPNDGRVSHHEAILRMSPAGVERFAAIFDTVPNLEGLSGNPPFAAAVALAFDPLLRAIRGDASLRQCPDLASIAGWLTYYRDVRAAPLTRLRRQFDGRGAIALFDFQMAGFLPMPTLAVATSSTDGTALMRQLAQLLERSGASGTPDETAATTTFRFRLLAYQFLLTQRAQDVGFAVGSVERSTLQRMLGEERSSPFLSVDVDPTRLAALLRPVLQQLQETATLGSAEVALLRSMLDAMDGYSALTVRGEREGRHIVIHTQTTAREASR